MEKLIAYTDGAARNNPGSGGWGAVLAVTRKDSQAQPERAVELGDHLAETTNNRAELTAVIKTLEWANEHGLQEVVVYTDSSYLIQGITNWRHNWQKNGWKTKNDEPVKNKTFWQKLIAAQKDLTVMYEHVEGHAGIPANERADDIATAFADQKNPDLFSGSVDEYDISLTPESQKLSDAPIYLSNVNGEIQQHNSWADCKQRVDGVQAQYRKVQTVPERDDLLEEWGKSPEDITT